RRGRSRGPPASRSRPQLRGRRPESPAFVCDGGSLDDARTRHDTVLMDIEPGASQMPHVHDPLLEHVAPAWSPRQRSLEGALCGVGPVAAVRGARGAPGPTNLARLKVDVIVAPTDRAIRTAQRATTTIPTVMVFATDPVVLGFVANLARPGGNITGLS